MFTKDIGIDLGTANTLVYMKGRGIIMREPSVVAVDPRSDELRVRSVGHEAKAVIGRAPGSIVAVRPLKDGVIADFDITAAMLQSFIRQACGNSILAHPRVVICVPSGVTEVERRAVRQAAAKAGARQVTVIEEPMAAAIGAGLPTTDAIGSMIVDIGGGTAEVAVISLSGIVSSRSVRCAGDTLDQSIIAFIKRKYNLLVGERTAEQIKIEIGSACPQDPETSMEIKGRNLVDGLPKDILIRSEEVREAMSESLLRIVDAINTKITASLDEATDRWGIKVNRVELKNIEPPVEIRQAMEKQMKADREKRASILLAEGEKQAAITRAEGEKESAILRAEAVKQQRIREAEGEAEALLTVQKAQADAIRMINEANPNHNFLALRSMEAMEKVADGKATKLIVPSDMQNLAATVAAIKEAAADK